MAKALGLDKAAVKKSQAKGGPGRKPSSLAANGAGKKGATTLKGPQATAAAKQSGPGRKPTGTVLAEQKAAKQAKVASGLGAAAAVAEKMSEANARRKAQAAARRQPLEQVPED